MTSQIQYNEVVQRLTKPVKPGEEWNINLTEDLREYQECIVNCDFGNSVGEDDNSIDCRPKATFIEGGLVVENASNTYSLRVDSAYETLVNCNESLRKTLLNVSTKDIKTKPNQVKESTKNAITTKTNDICKTQISNKQTRSKKKIKQKETNINKEHSLDFKFELRQDLDVKKDRNKRKISDTNYYKCSSHIPKFLLQKRTSDTKDTTNDAFINNSYNAVQHKLDFLVYSNFTNTYERVESDDEAESDDEESDDDAEIEDIAMNNEDLAYDDGVVCDDDTDISDSEEIIEKNSINHSCLQTPASIGIANSTFLSSEDIVAEACQEELEELLDESQNSYLSDSVAENFDKQDSNADSSIRLSGNCSDDSGFGSSPELLSNAVESDVQHCYYKDIGSNECNNSLLPDVVTSSCDEHRDTTTKKKSYSFVKNLMKKQDFLKLPEKLLKRKIIFNFLAELKKLKGGNVKASGIRNKNQEKKIKQPGDNLLKDSRKSNGHPKSTDHFQIGANSDKTNKTVTNNTHIANISSHEIPKFSQFCSMKNFNSFAPEFRSTPTSNNYTNNKDIMSIGECRHIEILLTSDSGIDVSYNNETQDLIVNSSDLIPSRESSLSDDDLDEMLEDSDDLSSDLIPSVENSNDQSALNHLQPNTTDVTSEYLLNNSEPEINSGRNSTKHLSLTEKYQIHDKDMEDRICLWQQSVKPQFYLPGNCSDLTLQHYEEIVLEKLRSAKNNKSDFGHILGRENAGYVGRYLLAILMLTNKGKVLVSQDQSRIDFRPSSICVELRKKQTINSINVNLKKKLAINHCNKKIRKQIPKL